MDTLRQAIHPTPDGELVATILPMSRPAETMKVTLLAWSRESGGAERQLVNLASGLRRRGHDVRVIVFFANQYVEAPLLETDTAYHVLNVRGRWDAWRYVVRFIAAMSAREDEVVYAFLQLPNLLTVLLKLFHRQTKVIWGIRTSDPDISPNLLTRVAAWLEKRLSPVADLVISNSFRGCDDAAAFGFDPGAITVIHNGIDTKAFRPDPQGGARLRAEWGVAADQQLIGLVGRLEAKKDHDTFVRAAAIAARQRADLQFVCIGNGTAAKQRRLQAQARQLGLEHRFFWTGFQPDMPAVYGALNVATLCSAYGEGFPNTLAEAMACGLPCVATDVGDAALILGDLGRVVPTRNPAALANAWIAALAESQAEDGASGIRQARRRRIEERYDLESMIDRTEEALAALL